MATYAIYQATEHGWLRLGTVRGHSCYDAAQTFWRRHPRLDRDATRYRIAPRQRLNLGQMVDGPRLPIDPPEASQEADTEGFEPERRDAMSPCDHRHHNTHLADEINDQLIRLGYSDYSADDAQRRRGHYIRADTDCDPAIVIMSSGTRRLLVCHGEPVLQSLKGLPEETPWEPVLETIRQHLIQAI